VCVTLFVYEAGWKPSKKLDFLGTSGKIQKRRLLKHSIALV
jgi:hypothetical protein